MHELTAVVPLLSLTAAFHYFNWLPPFISELKWFSDGVTKFGNYFRKKGWIGPKRGDKEDPLRRTRWWNRGEAGTKLVVE